jgi:hypothetical protein
MEYWSIYTFYSNITVLAALFRNGSPLGGIVFIYENRSSLWQKCTQCHAELRETLADLLYRVLAKWVQAVWSGRLSVASMCQSECSVSFYTDVWVALTEQCMDEDCHWTMMEVAIHRGIFGSAVFKVLWQDLKMRKFVAKWMPYTGNEAQQWLWYETCHDRLEWFCCEGNGLNWITAVRAFEWELNSKAWMLSSTFIMKMQVLEKLVTDKAVDHFTCCCLSSHSMGSHCEGTVLQVISAVPLMLCVWREVSGTGWKCHHVIMLWATQRTLLRMFSGNAGRKWYNILAVLLTSFHMSVVWFSNLSSHWYGKQFTNRDNIVTAVPLTVHQVMPKIFSAFHLVGSEP